MTSKYTVGELVWAKMKTFPSWPGRVSNTPPKLKKPKNSAGLYCIYFFGSNNYGWIEEKFLIPYEQGKEKLTQLCKTAAFKEAIKQIEAYIDDPKKYEAVFDNSQDEADFKFNELKENEDKPEKPPKPIKKTPGRKRLSTANSSHEAPAKASKPSVSASSILKSNISSSSVLKSSAASSIGKSSLSIIHMEYEDKDDSVSGSRESSYISSNHTGSSRQMAHLWNKPTVTRPLTPPIDLKSISPMLAGKSVTPTSKVIGFLGLGIMGRAMVKNLLHTGHKVVVWNRTRAKCNDFIENGAKMGLAPCEVVDAADIIFSCVPDPHAAREMIFGNCGVLQTMTMGKGYVEMTGIDSECSHDIADAIVEKGGRYLEAQIQGSRLQAEEGSLIILAAGDKNLFQDIASCFSAIGNNCLFLGAVGTATKMNLVLQTINAISMAGLVEAMALADRTGLQKKDVLEILEMTTIASPAMVEKSNAIIMADYSTHTRLTHLQKDLRLALGMAEDLTLPMPVTATANEVLKHAKRLGFGEDDVSALYFRARF
uniref:Cytokine-like nuclear factor N-PAC n=1 Tax=Xenopsylla cheopis TaxID=163159 RepID=A0A6M2DQM0_XENCH